MSYKIAVAGVNGFLGRSVLTALLSSTFSSKINHPIRIITHSDKKEYDSSKVEYYDFKDIDDALKGVDALVNLAGPAAQADILKAVSKSKIQLYIPSQFGTDLVASSKYFPGFLGAKTQHSDATRKAGIKTVDVITGLFFDDKTGLPPAPYGISILGADLEKKVITIVGDKKEQTLVNPTFLSDIGKSVAAIVTKDSYNSLPDTIHVYSDEVTYKDAITTYEKSTGDKLTPKYVGSEEGLADAKARYAKGFDFKDFTFYLDVIAGLGEGSGLIYEKNNERELINPKESVFKWVKYSSFQ